MGVAIVTGAGGLVGAEAAKFFTRKGLVIVGIDNDMRSFFFGADASTRWSWVELQQTLPFYTHIEADIRDHQAIERVFSRYGPSISIVIHTAAQPSHDWAAREPIIDFTVNANGTLNLLDATRRHCPEAVFIFCSTNKVYGDTPNRLPLEEHETRWELQAAHQFATHGIDETMSVDASMHSLFGVSKAAADLLVQEYGRYFGLKTACFRGGCLTGPGHSGARLHGFLSYLVKCAVTREPYTVFGYKAKQVRDNIHAFDLANAFWQFFQNPRSGEVYNIGGGREAHCSVLEAIGLVEDLTGRAMNWTYRDEHRVGDHVWWISDVRRFKSHYPDWRLTYDLRRTMAEIHDTCLERIRSTPLRGAR
jgi:CDP-paratose 2-epimerase